MCSCVAVHILLTKIIIIKKTKKWINNLYAADDASFVRDIVNCQTEYLGKHVRLEL